MPKIYLIHGFNVSDDGRATLGWLRTILKAAGHDVVMIKYGWVFRARVRICKGVLAKVIGSIVEPDSIAIGHSNGCDLLHKAAGEGARFKKVIYFNPSLDNDIEIPKSITDMTVFYSKNDAATSWAKWIPFSSWGNMGAVGYKGTKDFVVNIDEEELTGKKMGHSDFSKYPSIFGKIVVDLCSKDSLLSG